MNDYKEARKEIVQKVKDSFNRQEFMHFIGARLTVLKDGYCEIELDHKKELSQQHGFFHAGIIGSLADNAAGYAAFSKMEQDSSILSVEFKINLMSPGDGEKLIAKATNTRSPRASFIPKLTRREQEVLELIVSENTTQEIADKLFLSPSTVETHRMNLCAKMNARNTAGLVRNAMKLGLV